MLIRSEMTPTIAIAKIQQVAAKVRVAQPKSTHQGALNETLITEAIWFARRGESKRAFQQLARTVVPAGAVSSCCMLRSAQYGCSTHGYPRTN